MLENFFKKTPEQGGETITAEQQAELQAEHFASEFVLAEKGEWDLNKSFFAADYWRYSATRDESENSEQLNFAKKLVERNHQALEEEFEIEKKLIEGGRWDSGTSKFVIDSFSDVEASTLLRQKREYHLKLLALQKERETSTQSSGEGDGVLI